MHPHGFWSFDIPMMGIDECKKAIGHVTDWLVEFIERHPIDFDAKKRAIEASGKPAMVRAAPMKSQDTDYLMKNSCERIEEDENETSSPDRNS